MSIKFGTDGWRAVISDTFTFANVRKVAQAIAQQTLDDFSTQQPQNRQPGLVIGYDTRFLSDRYADAVAEVLAANGISVWLAHRDAPTPLVSYAILERQQSDAWQGDETLQIMGGVMITASHNPPRYNGIKLKAAYGGSASPEAAKEIERQIAANEADEIEPKQMDLQTAIEQRLVQRFDPLPAYVAHISSLVNFDIIRQAKPAVAIDAMYGAGRTYLSQLLIDAGCPVKEIRAEMNPGFNGSHPEPIARHLEPLIDLMGSGEYRVGLATDGDADRIGAVDESGRFIDPHCIMALLLDYLVGTRKLRGSVVKTVSTTQMLNRLAQRYDLPLHETPVGFNHISDYMISEDVLIGGEESGGISILGHIPEGDGVLMGLLLVELVAHSGKTLATLLDELMAASDIGPFRYARLDQAVPPFDKATLVKNLLASAPLSIAGQAVANVSDRDGVKFILADNSWLLIRPSGTEPVLRIYAEARSDDAVAELLEVGVRLADQ